MPKSEKGIVYPGADGSDVYYEQALIVTCGPFEGRICQNDNDESFYENELEAHGLEWVTFCDPEFRLSYNENDQPDEQLPKTIDCQVVSFGHYYLTRGYHCIPNQFLRPATMKDLVQRVSTIHEELANNVWLPGAESEDWESASLLHEFLFLSDEIRERELKDSQKETDQRSIFLCHSSKDKPFVRTVYQDLKFSGHQVWLDEFEIKVGESIIDKIEDATARADDIVLFVSAASVASNWVKKEWQSALSRQISGQHIRLLPAVIEDVPLPSLMHDVKFADFRESYISGLNELLNAIADT